MNINKTLAIITASSTLAKAQNLNKSTKESTQEFTEPSNCQTLQTLFMQNSGCNFCDDESKSNMDLYLMCAALSVGLSSLTVCFLKNSSTKDEDLEVKNKDLEVKNKNLESKLKYNKIILENYFKQLGGRSKVSEASLNVFQSLDVVDESGNLIGKSYLDF
jgi:hypothetical protein